MQPQSSTQAPAGYGMQMPNESGLQNPSQVRDYNDTEQLSRQYPNRNQPQQTFQTPELLTEFQKFVASTEGQVLPIYGSTLFGRVPSTFAPLDLTPVPSDFVIGPGDELRLRAWGQVSFQSNLRVDRSGDVYLPQVGPVHVAGLTFAALDAHLRGAVGRVYKNFDLTVDVGQIRAIQVYVSGQARRPGVYTVSSLSTLVDALFASGGPSLQGSMRHVQLRRNSTIVADFDLYNLIAHGDKSKDVKLESGDVLFIPAIGPQVAALGSVRNPGIYELRENESLADLFSFTGGVSAVASQARISIERIENHADRHAMEVAYDANGLNTRLADGDLIRAFSIVPRYQKTVTLRGNTANPGRFAWHPGMHVSELIPDKDSLITRSYWWKRAQLGLPAPEFEPAPNFAEMRQPFDSNPTTVRFPTPESQNTTSIPTSSQGTASPNQNLTAQQRGSSSSLASQQNLLSSRSVPSQRTEVLSLAPEIDWAYAVVERLDSETLKTALIPFDLGRLIIEHNASEDIELKPGDVVSIFSEADIRVPIAQQTKVVTLGGEFVHAGQYTVQPGESLRHLVERAGGFTPNAYLFGSEFTRQSTRAVQQARIDEYVQSLGMNIQRNNLSIASSGVTSAQDLQSSSAAQGSERDLIANLSQIKATGRIVLRLNSDSTGTGSLPEITLEDGDRLIVPPLPATVNVVGAVYDQNSFLYEQGRRAGSYLLLAGGPNRDADRKHEFIIRADGSVVSRDKEKNLWGSEFTNNRINPGDTIVVPEKIFKPSALRAVIDWSQVFSQLALGAASINVIK